MSQANSALKSIINQYTKQFVDRISELERENAQLKQQFGSFSPTLKTDFDRLTERHAELKSSYAEIERENTQLRQDMELLISQQKSLESDIEKHFQQVFTTIQPQQYQTPKKSSNVEMPQVAPNQKPIHRNAKATTKLLNAVYESDSELDSSDDEMPELESNLDSANEQEKISPRKLRFANESNQDPNKSFMAWNSTPVTTPVQSGSNSNTINLSSVLPNDDNESDDDVDDYESILKHIITEGLMSGLENINKSPHGNKSSNFDKHFTPRPESRLSHRSRIHVPTKKSKRPHYNNDQQRVQTQQSQQPNVSTNPTNTNGQNINNFPFRFMFSPQTGSVFSNANPNQPAQTSENVNPGQNHLNPSSQEVQLVQKILESLFNPPK